MWRKIMDEWRENKKGNIALLLMVGGIIIYMITGNMMPFLILFLIAVTLFGKRQR